MIHVLYDAMDGTPIADGKVRKHVDLMIEAHKAGKRVYDVIASEAVIFELRIRVSRGDIKHDELKLQFQSFDKQFDLPLDERGFANPSWPIGCCDMAETQALTILHCAVAKK